MIRITFCFRCCQRLCYYGDIRLCKRHSWPGGSWGLWRLYLQDCHLLRSKSLFEYFSSSGVSLLLPSQINNSHLVLTHHEYSSRSDGFQRIVSSKWSTLHLDTVHEQFVRVSEVVVGDADVSPVVEGRHLPVPATELGASLAGSEGSSAQVILAVQFIGLVIIEGVGWDVHPGSGVGHLEPVTVGVGQQRIVNWSFVFQKRVVSGISISLSREN